jgi:hypothetical protein
MHQEIAAQVHEHVHDNADVNLGEHVDLDAYVHGNVDVAVDGSCLVTS